MVFIIFSPLTKWHMLQGKQAPTSSGRLGWSLSSRMQMAPVLLSRSRCHVRAKMCWPLTPPWRNTTEIQINNMQLKKKKKKKRIKSQTIGANNDGEYLMSS